MIGDSGVVDYVVETYFYVRASHVRYLNMNQSIHQWTGPYTYIGHVVSEPVHLQMNKKLHRVEQLLHCLPLMNPRTHCLHLLGCRLNQMIQLRRYVFRTSS